MQMFTLRRSLCWLAAFVLPAALASQSSSSPLVFDGLVPRQILTPNTPAQILRFEHVFPGETYNVVVMADPSLPHCLPQISVPLGSHCEVLGYDASRNSLKVKALKPSFDILLDYPCTWSTDSPPRHYASIGCETCQTRPAQTAADADMAAIQVQPAGAVADLIRDVFIGGNCFDVRNVTYTGRPEQIGTFSNGATNIGFASGIIMATGNINVALGPNNADGSSAGFGLNATDSDLSTLTNGVLYDKANIEFDFTPTQSLLEFEFVFASEEYCEYVGSQFNDVFGFFISGPGIVGTRNLALVPNVPSPTPISVNTINHETNFQYYVHNAPWFDTDCATLPAATGQATNETEYDGFTKTLKATVNVVPCSTYHIKLKIADVSDGVWDSAVFLKAGSFSGGSNASLSWVVNGDPTADEAVEGCSQVELLIDRVGASTAAVPVTFAVSGTGASGTDFSPISGTYTIPAGQGQLLLPIDIINDLAPEGAETVVLTLDNVCSCLNPQTTLTINDRPELVVAGDTATICGPGSATLAPNIIEGVAPYDYLWSNGATGSSISPAVSSATNYAVTVTDGCGQTSVAQAQINMTAPPTAAWAASVPQFCSGQTNQAVVNLSGSGPFSLNYSVAGGPTQTASNITGNAYNIPVTQAGLYQLMTVTDANGCQGIGGPNLIVQASTLNLSGATPALICSGATNGSINALATGGQTPYNYAWNGPASIGNVPNPSNLPAGNYTVTVTDGAGCAQIAPFTIGAHPVIVPTIFSTQSANCAAPNGGSINLQVTGGSPNYTYSWSNNAAQQDPQNLAAGTYFVTITDQANCSATATATVAGDFAPPSANAGQDQTLNCTTTTLPLSGLGAAPNGSNFSAQWTTTNGQIQSGGNSLNPVVAAGGQYQLTITSLANGCTATDVALVSMDTLAPTVGITPAQPSITCIQPQVTLSRAPTNLNLTYNWSTLDGNILTGANSPSANVGAPGTYTLTAVSNTNGCTAIQAVTVSDNTTPPAAEAGPSQLLTCSVAQLNLEGNTSATTGFSYTWTTADGHIVSGANALNPLVNQAGTYQLAVTNLATGCVGEDEVTVEQEANVPTQFEVEMTKPTCKDNDGAISFGAVAGGFDPYLFSVDNGQTFGQTLDFSNISPGIYELWVQDANGCEIHQTLNVPRAPDPDISILTPEFDLALGDSVLLEAQLAPGYPLALVDSIFWTPALGLRFSGAGLLDQLEPFARPFRATEYTVTVVSKDGCRASDRTRLRVDTDPHIYIPNAFAPTSPTGGNEVLFISADADQVIRVTQFQIFDRWGDMVFQDRNFLPNDPAHGWSGQLGGKVMAPAVFTYVAEILLIDGRVLPFKGDVTLVR